MTHHTTIEVTVNLSEFNNDQLVDYLKEQGYTVYYPDEETYHPEEINQFGINFDDWERLQALLLEKIKLHGVYATEQLLQP